MLIDLRKKIRNAQFMFCSGRIGAEFRNFEFGFSLGFLTESSIRLDGVLT